MIKFRMYYDKDKGTRWLNEMAQKGYAMTGFFAGFWQFDTCEPGKYTYQVDFSDRFCSVSTDYREFMKETGIEVVSCWGPWAYLRKEASAGEFQLYTDVDSSIEHYTKILRMFKLAAGIELILLMAEMISVIAGNPNLFAVASVFILFALIIVLLNAVTKTRQTIAELKERKGEPSEGYGIGRRNVSPLVPCGMLVNSLALLLQNSVEPAIKTTLQIIAIVLMLVGVYRTARARKG